MSSWPAAGSRATCCIAPTPCAPTSAACWPPSGWPGPRSGAPPPPYARHWASIAYSLHRLLTAGTASEHVMWLLGGGRRCRRQYDAVVVDQVSVVIPLLHLLTSSKVTHLSRPDAVSASSLDALMDSLSSLPSSGEIHPFLMAGALLLPLSGPTSGRALFGAASSIQAAVGLGRGDFHRCCGRYRCQQQVHERCASHPAGRASPPGASKVSACLPESREEVQGCPDAAASKTPSRLLSCG